MKEKVCDFCSKQFATKQSCNIHKVKCKMKEQFYKTGENENKIKKLEDENKKLKEELDLLKSIIENQHKSNKISKQVNNNNSNNITIFNTNQSIKDLISNLEPINFEQMKEQFENNFSNKYVDKGLEGLVNFMCDISCQNKFVTTDYARKVISYKTQDQQVITDPKANILLNTALKQNADTIIDKAEDRYQYWKSQINDAREEDIEPDSSDLENKLHTKKLKNIAQKAKDNISVDSSDATNLIVLKGMKNKSLAIE